MWWAVLPAAVGFDLGDDRRRAQTGRLGGEAEARCQLVFDELFCAQDVVGGLSEGEADVGTNRIGSAVAGEILFEQRRQEATVLLVEGRDVDVDAFDREALVSPDPRIADGDHPAGKAGFAGIEGVPADLEHDLGLADEHQHLFVGDLIPDLVHHPFEETRAVAYRLHRIAEDVLGDLTIPGLGLARISADVARRRLVALVVAVIAELIADVIDLVHRHFQRLAIDVDGLLVSAGGVAIEDDGQLVVDGERDLRVDAEADLGTWQIGEHRHPLEPSDLGLAFEDSVFDLPKDAPRSFRLAEMAEIEPDDVDAMAIESGHQTVVVEIVARQTAVEINDAIGVLLRIADGGDDLGAQRAAVFA